MPFLIENILTPGVWLIGLGGSGLAIFVIVAVQRRVRRGQFFRGVDAARVRAQHQLQILHDNPEKLKELIPQLKRFRSPAEWQALEDVFLDRPAPGVNFELVRKVAVDLGWVQEWIETLRCRRKRTGGRLDQMLKEMGDTYETPVGFGRLRTLWKTNFMERCMAAKRLSQVPTPEGMIALMAGTDDPDEEVREAARRGPDERLCVAAACVSDGEHRASAIGFAASAGRFRIRGRRTAQAGTRRPSGRSACVALDTW